MDESRRERKKRQTRQLLYTTALRLFAEQGYEQTTVSQIAAAADVATKTFFNYFPAKEDVVFAHFSDQYGLLTDLIAAAEPDADIPALLRRTLEETVAAYATAWTPEDDLVQVYGRLVLTVPALQARAMMLGLEMQRRIAGALVERYPDRFDAVTAGAVVGAFIGAFQGAALAAAESGPWDERVVEAARRGLDVAIAGIAAVTRG